MNAKTRNFDLELEGGQVEEAVSSIFHTVLFHRTLGKFHYKEEGNYDLGTVGYEDVDCNLIDLTYVRCSSSGIKEKVHREVAAFSECLRSWERETQGQSKSGHISLTFYQAKKPRWPFGSVESISWEIWDLNIKLLSLTTEAERQRKRDDVSQYLADIIIFIAQFMNQPTYVPKVPDEPELGLIFDTSFKDIQPYLFKIEYITSPPSTATLVGTNVIRLFKDTLSL